jgi:hypothetical protein
MEKLDAKTFDREMATYLAEKDLTYLLNYIRDMAIDRVGSQEDKIFAFAIATIMSLYASQVMTVMAPSEWPDILNKFTKKVEDHMNVYLKKNPHLFDESQYGKN